jgi:fused signal recognition particle receptor
MLRFRRGRNDQPDDDRPDDDRPDDDRPDDDRPDSEGGRTGEVSSRLAAPPRPVDSSSGDRTSIGSNSPVVESNGSDDGLAAEPEEQASTQPGIRNRLGRTIGAPFRGLRRRGKIDEELLAELEDALLIADVGLPTTMRLIAGLREMASSKDAPEPLEAIRQIAVSFFEGDDTSLHIGEPPSVWLFVGVNGVGKTTTIGKLARREALAGRSVVAAAGDTFRAAAVEQLEIWADRADVEIVTGSEGADPASVVYDAIQHAAARGADLVLADTAGRLHTKANLMAELEKVRRIAERPPGHVAEVLLVIDATTGQNGLAQARQFTESVGVTGIVLTKLDGSAKGGVVLAIRSELGIPIKLIGLGEGADDLVEFDAEEFVSALLD